MRNRFVEIASVRVKIPQLIIEKSGLVHRKCFAETTAESVYRLHRLLTEIGKIHLLIRYLLQGGSSFCHMMIFQIFGIILLEYLFVIAGLEIVPFGKPATGLVQFFLSFPVKLHGTSVAARTSRHTNNYP